MIDAVPAGAEKARGTLDYFVAELDPAALLELLDELRGAGPDAGTGFDVRRLRRRA
jgi:hypothetical protein